MRKAGLGAASLLFASLSACVETPAPVVGPPKPTEVAVAPVATATAEAGPDLSPVSEPSDIVGLARWRSPIATASNLGACAGIAKMLVDVNARVGVDALFRKVLRGSADTRQLAGLVALDAPVDVILALDPQMRPRPPLRAVAVGLSSLEGAKVAISNEGTPLKELGQGMWAMKGGRGMACAIAASAGQTPARLVCAEHEKSLEALAPYLARTAPSLDLGTADMHIEARLDVLRKRYGESVQGFLRSAPGAMSAEYGTGDQRFDRPLFEAATAMEQDTEKLLGDLDRVTVEARTEKSGACLRAQADLALGNKASWIAGTLTDRADRSGPPPSIYWRQPKDSELAFYTSGVDPARFATVLPKARELLNAALVTEGLDSAADRKKITDILDLPYGKDTHGVLSHGTLSTPYPEPTAKGAPTTSKGAPTTSKGVPQAAVEAGWSRIVGWTLIGVDEGPAAMKKHLKAVVDAYKLPSVQGAFKKELSPGDLKNLPIVKAGTAPASLGTGAEALEITIPNVEAPPSPDEPKPKTPPTLSLKIHVLLMADSDATWLAIGASKDDLVKKLLTVKSGAATGDQLSARSGLDTLKNGKQMAGGFLSGALLAYKWSALYLAAHIVNPQWVSDDEVALAQSLVSLPNHAQTPFLVTENVTAGTPTKISIAVEAQQGTFEDAKALVLGNYKVFSKMGLLP